MEAANKVYGLVQLGKKNQLDRLEIVSLIFSNVDYWLTNKKLFEILYLVLVVGAVMNRVLYGEV